MSPRIPLFGLVLLLLALGPAAEVPGGVAGAAGAQPTTLVKAGSFAKRTSIGVQSVTGVGFAPKLLILFGVANTSDGFGEGYQYGFGASDGTSSGAISGWSWDGRGSLGSDADRRQVARAITFTKTIAGIEAEADLLSFDDDGFTLDWTTNNVSPWIINYLAIGGDEVQAEVSSFDAGDSSGLKAYTHVGFRPDAILLFGAPSINGPLEASFGMADLYANQFAMSVASQDTGVNPTNTARYQRTDRCFVALDPASEDIHVESEASMVSMDPEGFTLDWSVPPGPSPLISVAIKGVRARVGWLTEGNGEVSYGDIGFEPRGALFVGFNHRATGDVTDSNRFTIGGVGQNGEGASIWLSDQDGVADDTRTDQATYSNKCYVGEDSPTSPLVYSVAADLKSWDANGFTLTWSGFAPSPAQIGYLLFGDAAPPAVGGIAELPNDTSTSNGAATLCYVAIVCIAAGIGLTAAIGSMLKRRAR